MAKTRNPEIVKRNDMIYSEWLRGASLTGLGAKYGIARQVVARIVAAQHPEEAEDDDRSLFRGYMWRLYDEVQEIAERPGFKMRPDGNPAYGPDDEIALDTQVQVQAKELQLKILRELRLLDARDRAQPKQVQVEFTLAQQAMMDDIRRREQVIRGEVVAELPPGQPAA